MELGSPLKIVTPTLDGDVLAVLSGADAEFTPPAVHEILGRFSESGVRKALERLAVQGIVLQRRRGQAWLYALNRDHLGAPAIVELAHLKDRLIERLREHVRAWRTPPVYAAVFGSAARSDMRADSDIDLFVVRPVGVDPDEGVWPDQLGRLARDATAWTGNDTRVLEFGQDEIGGSEDPLLVAIRDEGLRFAGPMGYLRRIGPEQLPAAR